MPQTPFHDALRQIYDLAVAFDAPYPVYRSREELRKIPKPWGLAYWAPPQQKHAARFPWFPEIRSNLELRKRLAAEGKPAPTFDDQRPRLILVWPYLLENAFDPDAKNPLRLPAWTVLLQLRPLIAKFDKVLEYLLNDLTLDDLETVSKPLAIRLAKLHWFHLTRKNRVFRRALTETMSVNLRPILDTHSYQGVRACPSKHKVTFDKKCPDCEAFRWLDYGVNIVWAERLGQRDLVPLFFTIPPGIEGFFPHKGHGVWDAEFLWMLSCVSPEEGVILTDDNQMVVNFSLMADIAEELKRDSVFRRFSGGSWQRGLAAREHCTAHTSGLLSRRGDVPMMERVDQCGWSTGDLLNVPYDQFSVPAIRQRLRINESLTTRYGRSIKRKPPRRATAFVDYVDSKGETHEIEFFFRTLHGKKVPFYYVPWLDGVTPDQRGYRFRFEDRAFWSLRGVVHNRRLDAFTDELDRFEKWLADYEMTLTPAVFKRMLYSQRLNERVDEIQKGERKHLTRFAEIEDQRIRDFVAQRSPGTLTSEEWVNLRSILPGRTKIGILRRWHALALEYALQKGWENYFSSGWRVKHSAKRRKEWVNLGVLA